VSARATLGTRAVAIGLACANGAASCLGRISLSARLHGRRRSFGSHAVTVRSGRSGRFSFPLPAATRTVLRTFAGKTLSLQVVFVAKGSRGTQRSTRLVRVRVPR
jgi:hypothetical protein